MGLLALFPGALGDFICFRPTLCALARQYRRTTVVLRPELDVLLPEGCTPMSIDRREIADLFSSGTPKPSTYQLFAGFTCVHSWTGHGSTGFAARLGAITGAEAVQVHPFRALAPAEHASEYYARCARVPLRWEHWRPPEAALAWARALLHDHPPPRLVMHAGSGSPRKNWEGFPEIASWWKQRGGALITLSGPAEQPPAWSSDIALHCAPLERVAAVLASADLYCGNDSGVSHLAALVGARGLALFGPTDPEQWRPLGTIETMAARCPCAHCGEQRFCTHRLAADSVAARLRAVAELAGGRTSAPLSRPRP